ncbi:MAG: TRAP transporter small permease [Desulfobulbaceae bacterium]|nr:MAG: TRAP transporter small permease [Desulfobulbaceae bacterium]
MTIIVIAQVISRYGLNHSLFWSEELARYLLVWLTFLGATVAYFRGMHPGVDVIYRRLSPENKRYLRIISHLLCLILFLVMIWQGTQFSYFVRLQITPALNLPKWTIFSIIPISGLIFMLHGFAFIWRELFTGEHRHE